MPGRGPTSQPRVAEQHEGSHGVANSATWGHHVELEVIDTHRGQNRGADVDGDRLKSHVAREDSGRPFLWVELILREVGLKLLGHVAWKTKENTFE